MLKHLLFSLFIFISSYGWGIDFNDSDPVVLNGENLTLEDVLQVARHGKMVKVSPEVREKVSRSHQLLLAGAKFDIAIYGLNRGVGLNKDRKIFQGDSLDPEIKQISEQFNRNLIYSHSTGVGGEASEEVVRAAMLVRLNTLLRGVSGIQLQAVDLLEEFLNRHIHPLMPTRGSVGEADIAILSHIGLAMMGEGEVLFLGNRVPTKIAMRAARLEPLKPYAKDALSILSSNAYSVGLAVLTLHDLDRLLDHMNLIFAMSLEGLNGNVAPFLAQVQKVRPFCSQCTIAKKVRGLLKGSYLWQQDSGRALQDPLSFRNATQVHGALLDLIEGLKKQMTINLNSSDDNPSVLVDLTPDPFATEYEKQYYLDDGKIKGAIIPSANFEPILWAIKFESLGTALAHIAHSSVQRMIHLAAPEHTTLSRFLASNDKSIAFGTIQKAFMELNTEIRSLADPVSTDSLPVAGNIEDHATNAPLLVRRVEKIVDNLIYIAAIEEMHAAQAMDLRKRKHADQLSLGKATEVELNEYRKIVPFHEVDRVLSTDIQNGYEYLKKKIKLSA